MSYVKKYKKLIQILAFVLVLFLFSFYAYNNRSEFNRLTQIGLFDIFLIITGQLTILFSAALILREVIVQNNKNSKLVELLKVTAYSSLVNFFGFLQGGVGIRAVFVKTKQSISYKSFFGFTIIQYLSLFYISFILIIVSVFLSTDNAFLIIIIIMLLCAPVLYQGTVSLIVDKISYLKKYNSLKKYNIKNISLINVIQIIGSLLVYGISLHAIGANIDIKGLLIYTAIGQFSLAFAITPGAVGIREGLLLLASSRMGIGINDIVIASTLERLLLFVTFAIITPVAFAVKNNKNNYIGSTNTMEDKKG